LYWIIEKEKGKERGIVMKAMFLFHRGLKKRSEESEIFVLKYSKYASRKKTKHYNRFRGTQNYQVVLRYGFLYSKAYASKYYTILAFYT
jgi:hypothetical protein